MMQDRPQRPENPQADTNSDDGKRQGRPKMDKKPYLEDGAPKLKEWPADFDSRVHKPLKVEDFEAEDVFWLKRAEIYDQKAADCRTKAELFTKFGSADQRKAIEKMSKLSSQLELLKSQLAGEGVNVADVLAAMSQ